MLLRIPPDSSTWLYRAVTFYGVLSSTFKPSFLIVTRSYNPATICMVTVWASPISIASTLGMTIDSLFLWVLRCVTSPRSLNASLWIQEAKTQLTSGQVVPFGDPGIGLCAAPPGLSQLTTSFIAS